MVLTSLGYNTNNYLNLYYFYGSTMLTEQRFNLQVTGFDLSLGYSTFLCDSKNTYIWGGKFTPYLIKFDSTRTTATGFADSNYQYGSWYQIRISGGILYLTHSIEFAVENYRRGAIYKVGTDLNMGTYGCYEYTPLTITVGAGIFIHQITGVGSDI